jgi:Fe-S cluster assembly ATP-binding protein
MSVMGHPLYEIVDGKLTLDGQDITDMEPHERAKL